uniref:Uncharacterized protein n=1 Tax=Cyanistes caeruleus TaxID=156563 RepID=A0A8C0V2Y3_CYACU
MAELRPPPPEAVPTPSVPRRGSLQSRPRGSGSLMGVALKCFFRARVCYTSKVKLRETPSDSITKEKKSSYFKKCPFCLSELVWFRFFPELFHYINSLEPPSLKHVFVYEVPWPFLMHYKIVTSHC